MSTTNQAKSSTPDGWRVTSHHFDAEANKSSVHAYFFENGLIVGCFTLHFDADGQLEKVDRATKPNPKRDRFVFHRSKLMEVPDEVLAQAKELLLNIHRKTLWAATSLEKPDPESPC